MGDSTFPFLVRAFFTSSFFLVLLLLLLLLFVLFVLTTYFRFLVPASTTPLSFFLLYSISTALGHLLTFRVFSPRSGTYSYLLIYCIVYIYVHNICNSKQWHIHSSVLSGEYSIYIVSVSFARLLIFRIEK